MNTHITKRHPGKEGSILAVSMVTLAVISAGIAVAVSMTANTTRLADRSRDFAVLQAATEGTLEYAYGIWKGRLAQQNRAITSAEAMTSLTLPTFPGVTVADGGAFTITACDSYGVPTASLTSAPIDPVPGHNGWRGRSFSYLASVKLKSTSALGTPMTYGIKRYFYYSEVPLFQAIYFFEQDLEIYRPNTMIIGGLVHTNRWGFVSNDLTNSYPVTFQGYVSNVMGWTNSTIPYKADLWSGYVTNANQQVTFSNGIATQLSQTSRLEAFGQDPTVVFDAPPTSPLSPSGQLIGADGDSDGNPNNDSMHELIEPPVAGYTDPPEISKRRLYNKAAIIVTVNGTTKTVTAQNGATLTAAQITTIQTAITTSTMYDQREQATVRISNLDVGAVRTTLDATTGFNGLLYMRDTTTGTTKNAIRLKNGGVLPNNGLTVASPNGVYIQGDYNTGTTTTPTSVPSNVGNANNTATPTLAGYTRKPSAVVADAVMILSNAWSDSNASSALTGRIASNTTVNTALLAGFMPSGFTPTSGTQYGYSGGANNYPRFLEDWSNKYMTYFGSMAQLFQSTSYTGRWDTGSIYAPPKRCWNYDTNFSTISPPGSIDTVAVSRGTWQRF